MLLAVHSSFGRTRTLTDAARELGLPLSFFPDAENLKSLLRGKSRRLVLLAEAGLQPEIARCLEKLADQSRLGLIVCADPDGLRSSERAALIQRFARFDNVEWLAADHDIDALTGAARNCRRRMLRLGEEALRKALDERQLYLQYQPKVENGTDAKWHTCEAEALIRWRHPEHGFVSPLEFLPEAEAFGLAGPIGDFVLAEAAAQLCRWRKQGLTLNSCINLAPSQLNDPDLPRRYRDIVAARGLECRRFTFEITEQDLADPETTHLKVLHGLRACGFRIALDNFRVAAGSLGTFEELPFDEIKIHAAALKRAQTNPASQKMLAAVTALARNLGVSVCVDCIEDLATYDLLRSIECDKLQGFLISESVLPNIMRHAYHGETERKTGVGH